jgi:hypothetical protein
LVCAVVLFLPARSFFDFLAVAIVLDYTVGSFLSFPQSAFNHASVISGFAPGFFFSPLVHCEII